MKLKEFENLIMILRATENRLKDEKISAETRRDFRQKLEKIKQELNNIPKVNAIFCCGNRSYHEFLYKVEKSYFNSSFMKLKKHNRVQEIDRITPEMERQDLADLYYY